MDIDAKGSADEGFFSMSNILRMIEVFGLVVLGCLIAYFVFRRRKKNQPQESGSMKVENLDDVDFGSVFSSINPLFQNQGMGDDDPFKEDFEEN